jgi:hypothetical protein
MHTPRFPRFVRLSRARGVQATAALTVTLTLVVGLACDEKAPTETRAPSEVSASAGEVDGLAQRDAATMAIPLPVNQSVATTAPAPAFKIRQTGTGPNGIFQVARTGSFQPALQGLTNGRGQAGLFQTTNTTNDAPTLQALSNGINVAILGLATGTGGAGVFHLNNRASTQSALVAMTTGSGPAVHGISVRSAVGGMFESNDGVALRAVTGGNSPAGEFSINAGPEINPSVLQVFGNQAAANPQAARFVGDVAVVGTLTKSGGSFRIDHPLDPEHKYLSHSFMESPDMMNVYNGNVTLDANGRATVELPDYFEALNRDFRYQLTAVGAPGPNLYIAEGVTENRFRIAGGRPYARVSWMVTGVRQDTFANEHRIKVEEEKPRDDKNARSGRELVARR